MDVVPVHVWVLVRSVLAATFLIAGVSKVVDRSRFERSLRGYGLRSPRAISTLSLTLPAVEIVVALGLYSGIGAPWPMFGSLCLLAAFSLALAWVFARGRRDLDCGCFTARRARAVGPFVFARNLALLLIGVMALVFASGDGLSWPARSLGTVGPEGVVVEALATAGVLIATGVGSLRRLFTSPGIPVSVGPQGDTQ